jgi:hypothetical protein
MLRHSHLIAFGCLILTAGALPCRLFGLDPSKNFAQYTRTIWTQAQGLPQDTIRAIAQTPDGYIWLGTTEGLARFDGYEFVTFTKDQGNLPSNSVTALCVGHDDRLWGRNHCKPPLARESRTPWLPPANVQVHQRAGILIGARPLSSGPCLLTLPAGYFCEKNLRTA